MRCENCLYKERVNWYDKHNYLSVWCAIDHDVLILGKNEEFNCKWFNADGELNKEAKIKLMESGL